MNDRVRVALLGAGRIGAGHARVLAAQIPDAELVAIADAYGPAAESVANSVRVDRWSADPLSVIDSAEIDAVVIASSTDSHAALISAAAAAGKHIFCEKPVALDLETTDAALDAVSRAGVIFQIGFQRRFDPAYARAKAAIETGAIGAIEQIRDVMRDPGPPPRAYAAVSGGLYRDMTIHNFDCVRWLIGAEATELFAMGAALVDPTLVELNDIDTSIVSIRFANGALAVIDNSRRSGFGYDVRTEVFGSAGALWIGYQAETAMVSLTRQGVVTDHVEFFLERFATAYADELRAFVAAVRLGQPASPGAIDARAAMQLAYAADASRTRNLPVDPREWAR